ncbi:MAG: Gfo/Idh/MocA family oxidoreductase [Spirochaetales bacterium]|nr:Gfo/Idh/MocA family oxidoreductase [Spirochaetales bacterium]MCF7938173.1 Gfo/Idh/MocA family oxidoreductase [Spirochaetales bacterium]
MKPLTFGILGNAKIAREHLIPGMHESKAVELAAIASRNKQSAEKAAADFNIPKAYGSYEELLADPQIEAVYIPLPNHLHVEWTINALRAGKHVLCEKPIALNLEDVRRLQEESKKAGRRVQEAFMVRTHPQWIKTRELAHTPEFGRLRAAMGFFSYYNPDPENIRNKYTDGGGGLWDIGCYPITTTRFVFGEEPTRVAALLEHDLKMQVDRLGSALMEFPSGQATFISSTQVAPYQTMSFVGEKQRVEVEVPFNQIEGKPAKLFLDDGADTSSRGQEIILDAVNQYAVELTEFARAVREDLEMPVPLSESLKNIAVILSVFEAAKTGQWVRPADLLGE